MFTLRATQVSVPTLDHSFPQRFGGAFEAELEHFIKVLAGTTLPAVTREDCIRAQAVANAALDAYRAGASLPFEPVPPSPPGAVVVRPIGNGNFGQFIAALVKGSSRLGPLVRLLPPYTRSSGLELQADVLRDRAVEAVYVASPDAMHTQHALAALRSGKHVFVEKPIAEFGAVAAAAAAASGHLVLMVGFHRRFDAEFLRARECARASLQAGRSLAIRVESFDPVPAGDAMDFVMANSVSHDLDMLFWLLTPDGADAQPPAFTVTGLECDPACCAASIELELEVRLGTVTQTVGATISYSKLAERYTQLVHVDGQRFGYDAAVPAGEHM